MPQSLGTDDNAIITVGAVTSDGKLDIIGRPQKPGEAGSISVYAPGTVSCYMSDNKLATRDTQKTTKRGTSFAAPAVIAQAGLAAYFLGLEELKSEFP
ncbi:subtilisin-like protein [Penicillium capsulatum]|uniref:Subtilisin-like protein n=1 Tax=Penicillium capsulatum TaxID=69766 RepID=A0A9W9I3Q1_9EURO|nr:subtilisin-like protein [Penicillium capsulatum]KAJ6108882.1 subtilisin-like protein [Penicillium capsulatum]